MKTPAQSAWEKMHPKLRMMCNGDEYVNTARAEVSACLKVSRNAPRKMTESVPNLRQAMSPEEAAGKRVPKRTKLKLRPKTIRVHAFVETRGAAGVDSEMARQGNLAIVDVAIEEVAKIAKKPAVTFIEHAEALKFPRPMKLGSAVKAPTVKSRAVAGSDRHKDGADVLIGIIDVDGFDFAHPDFRDKKGGTRFLRIWDQGGEHHAPPSKNNHGRFDYGSELLQAHLTKALKDAPKVKVSPHDLAPQSQMTPGSHGTHVASIAAGNYGVCRKAQIVAVLVSLPAEDIEDRRKSFYDSTRLVDAVEYLLGVADELNKPISINISLGTNGHAHDGSSSLDRWIDAWLVKPGRSITVAAGNAGQEKEETPGDMGYIFGRIHTSGRLAAKDLLHDIEWLVAGDGIKDVSENELELWYESQDRFAVQVKPPGGDWSPLIRPREHLENLRLPQSTMLSVYNDLYHPANGHNYISVYLSPFIGRDGTLIGIQSGTWVVRVTGLDVRDGRFHAWIERDDPAGFDGRTYFPSCFSERSNVDLNSVSSLACGQRVISVANLDEMRQCVNASSSQGPTRDGRPKPDVAASGTAVIAANGFGRPDEPWIGMTGTSMASPFVAGVVGLMLNAEPKLRASQINGILKATARPLPGKTYEWSNDCGFGVINAAECVREARQSFELKDVKERFK